MLCSWWAESIHKDGRVDLFEKPEGRREGRVRVLLIEEDETKPTARFLEFGKYKGEKETTLEDFAEAEWHGEAEFDDLQSNR